MGYNESNTNRTGTLWDTIGLILTGLEHYGMGHNGINTNRTGTLWDGTQWDQYYIITIQYYFNYITL